MNTADNKQLLQQIFAALAQGDARPYVASMADDFRWIINGSSRWSKTYEGKAAVVNELFPLLRAIMADRIRTVATRFIAEGDQVVVQARGDNVTRAGKPYRNSYCFVFTLRDGKLAEGIEYMDTDLALAMLGDPAAVTV